MSTCSTVLTDGSAQCGNFNFIIWSIQTLKNYRKRTRREAKDDGEWTLARVPNTKWCGRGNSAITSSDLGGYASADRCCRQHDINCGHFINAWEEKFDLVNQRPYTAMHCVCDDRYLYEVDQPSKNKLKDPMHTLLLLNSLQWLYKAEKQRGLAETFQGCFFLNQMRLEAYPYLKGEYSRRPLQLSTVRNLR